MDTRKKIKRLLKPRTLDDYGLVVSVEDVVKDTPDIFLKEIAPHLPGAVLKEIIETKS